jgi:GNAT superfamily N-acetyltransferase
MKRTFSHLAFQIVRLFNRVQTRGYEVRLAESEADLDQVWRLNYETYVKELRQEQVSAEVVASGLLPDRFRDNSVYIIALHRGELVGMVAITLPTGPFSIESSLTDPGVLAGTRDQTVELRRLAIKRAHRGKGVFLRLTDLTLQWGFGQGYRHAIMSALDTKMAIYSRLGFQKFDQPFIKGACTYQPMRCSLDLFLSPEIEKAKLPLAEATLRRLGHESRGPR